MNITIHRGTREIGGTCIQVTAGDRSILLDAGAPLGESASFVDLPRLSFTDLFISHPHQDHYGLIDSVAPQQTVHIGAIGRQLIDTTRIFLGGEPLAKTFSNLKNRTWVELGDAFRVMPYLMDHSCVDAFGFLVEAGGKRLYYSGDFRAHGRRDQAFKWFLDDPPGNVDVLLLEGTMMGRDNDATPSEAVVEDKMVGVLRQGKDLPFFLVSSGQHIDRLCAAFKACLKTGRALVVDMYTASVLRTVSRHLPNVPDIKTTDRIKVLVDGKAAGWYYERIKTQPEFFEGFVRDVFAPGTALHLEEILAAPSNYLIKVSKPMRLMDRLEHCGVIYSMWSGYLQEPDNQVLLNSPKVTFHEIHTSGHATRDDLRKLASAVKPKRLIAVHTEYPAEYKKLFAGHQVLSVMDGQAITI